MKARIYDIGNNIDCEQLAEQLGEHEFEGQGSPGFEIHAHQRSVLRADYLQVEFREIETWDEEQQRTRERTVQKLRKVPFFLSADLGRAFFCGTKKALGEAQSRISTAHHEPISFRLPNIRVFDLFQNLIDREGWFLREYKLKGYKPREGIEGDLKANPDLLDAAREEIEENRAKLNYVKMKHIERGRLKAQETQYKFDSDSIGVKKSLLGEDLTTAERVLAPLRHTSRQKQVIDE